MLTAIEQFKSVRILSYPRQYQSKIRKFLQDYLQKKYLNYSTFAGWNLHEPLSKHETTFTNNGIESYHGRLGAMSGSGKNSLAKACSVIYTYKVDNRLAVSNREFKPRNQRSVEKLSALQRFDFELRLLDDENFMAANAMEIALKIGDILSPPDPSKAYSKHHKFYSSFEFPTEK